MTAPGAGVPDGAYTPASVGGMQHMTEASIMSGLRGPMDSQAMGVHGIFWGALGLVRGVIETVVGGIAAVIGAIGGLFSAGHRDTAAVDAARVAGENAIVANMSSSLEFLDEIQRVGGAYSSYPEWWINYGEENPHPLPLNQPFPLAQGTAWHPPHSPLSISSGHRYAGNDSNRGVLARGSGTLELQESGLWMIYFQAALLQGNQYTNTPADVWCYVTDNSARAPVGAPPASGNMEAYWKYGSGRYDQPVSGILAYGRAGQYLGIRDTNQGGGNTVSGYMLCYLDSPGWYVHLACSGFRHFGGAASTFVFATKVNSSTLRTSINNLKTQLAAALPGQGIPMDLSESAIQAMVSEAADLEVPPVRPNA